jgi:FixJ family two-component response regulator
VDKPTVFVVDDDDAAAASVAALMGVVGLRALVFHSAEAFLDAYDGTGSGCLVLDIRLTGMSGLDLRKVLHQRGLEIPTILISGHIDSDSCQEALRGGVVACLEKPYDGQELCTLVQSALR